MNKVLMVVAVLAGAGIGLGVSSHEAPAGGFVAGGCIRARRRGGLEAQLTALRPRRRHSRR